ncbi:DUF4442 domain-containing protein [Lacinutrix sp. 5H-3-7-4]|uniref:DUF4442 domain-containing protein n=1 Tax=Lacinutrix sp. (strain 5H-3-7-4) TaxID=983544 RepID=UPI00020A3A41|nr:DUF4442 domain-containing protein [Lacinutrix sp. 5H-3-7-4]AEH00953.1 hypothetical protein Lacal_1105 [Lacinutrix sp. 5H-3-7-4]
MYRIATNFLKRFFKTSTIYKYGFNWSPMYKRSTAKLIQVSDNLQYVKIKLKPSWKNRNYAGSIFGGSMLSATDPIYMIQLIQILGDDFVVWDKAASIKYKRPAKETIYAEFVFLDEEIKNIKNEISLKNEVNITKKLTLKNAENIVFAEIEKTIYATTKTYYKEKLKQRKQQQNTAQ